VALGYNSAMVDLVWTRLLLEYGRHWSEKRYFRDAGRFLEVMAELEPTFAPAYLYADTFLTYQPTPDNHSTGTVEDAIAARRFIERGLVARPGDHELWQHYGQYLAVRGNSYFSTDSQEWESWRRDGAMAIARAMELGAKVETTMAAAAILGKAGEREATIRYLERAYALTDDPSEQEAIGRKLAYYRQSSLEEAEARTRKRMDAARGQTYPFLSRTVFLLIGPMPDALSCAGDRERQGCAYSWRRLLAVSSPASP
jgi:tetratricopeptide (TPR) repeat protein